jgi:uncharacterized protein (DUF1015 family)
VAHVRAFRGVRYAPRVALGDVLAPPYDVISASQREALARHPENVVHLELPLDEDGPGSRYQAAARRWRQWLTDGVVEPDPGPAVYPYAQRFVHEGKTLERRGVFGLVELVPPGPAGNIYPHEFTLSGPREDRLRLLAATHVNLSPIFLLYEGALSELAGAWDHTIASAYTPWGTSESLGHLTGERAEAVTHALSARPLVFADGHHRYESALRYAEESGATSPDDPRRYLLAVFVERSDPGLLVLPTHRIVKAAPGPELASLRDRAFASAPVNDAESWLEAQQGPAFVMASPQGLTGLNLEAPEILFGSSPVAPALRDLDVVVLHAFLERGFGLTPEAVRDRGALAYTRNAEDAVAAVAAREGTAFLLRATPVERVIALATAGHRLPQKSTYFEPKLTSGWLFHAHDVALPKPEPVRLAEEKR